MYFSIQRTIKVVLEEKSYNHLSIFLCKMLLLLKSDKINNFFMKPLKERFQEYIRKKSKTLIKHSVIWSFRFQNSNS